MIIAASKYGLSAARLPLYEYTGQAPLFFKDSQGNWEIVFTGDCTVTFSRLHGAVDIFAVGGGMPAGNSVGNGTNYAIGGTGGRGGGCVTDPGRTLTVGQSYPVQIGSSSLSTSAFGVTAPAGGGSGGGNGATVSENAGNGAAGVLAFGRSTESDLTLYEASLGDSAIRFGAGGGGGAAKASSGSLRSAGSGGATGGGAGGDGLGSGGSDTNQDAKAGKPNTGGGGGGGSRNNTTGSGGNFPGPGAGGSGIVIIRNVRAST